MENKMKKIFLICPVRNATDEQKQKMAEYIETLENDGMSVYYPARDTKQVDETGGWNICTANKNAIIAADEVHIFWDEKSTGSLFDLGMAFGAGKKLIVANPESIHPENTKSFHNLINYWKNR
jgi:nucleoside 2-deoxyribosyltransferase